MADDPLLGMTIGQYTIRAQIGRGGMAIVYRADQPSMGREVAIKVIDPRIAQTELFVSRFEREVRLISRLQHPHILPVYDFGQEPTQKVVFLVMRLVEGGSLDARIRGNALTLGATRTIFGQVAGALAFAHSEGIIHRDLKPNNVLLDRQGNPYLTDFGLARTITDHTNLTETGNILGTPAYMAPEQWRSEPLDPRTDIYALGIMLFEMLSGTLPYQSDTPYQMMYKHLDMPVPSPKLMRPDLPDAIVPVLQKALAKHKEDRYGSASEFAADVDNALGGTWGLRDTAFPATQPSLPPPPGVPTDIVRTPPPSARPSIPPSQGPLPPTAPPTVPPSTESSHNNAGQPGSAASAGQRRIPVSVLTAVVAFVAAIAGIVLVLGPLRPLVIGGPTATGPLPTITSPFNVIAALPSESATAALTAVQATAAPNQATTIPAVQGQTTVAPATSAPIAVPPATSDPTQRSATRIPETPVSTSQPQPGPPDRPEPTATPDEIAADAPSTLPTARPEPTNTAVPPTVTPTHTPPPTATPIPPTLTSIPTNTVIPPTITPYPTATALPPTLTPVPPSNTPKPTATLVPPSNTPRPTDTLVPPSNTPRPTDTLVPPSNTPKPTATPIPPTEAPIPAVIEPTDAPGSRATQAAQDVAALPEGFDFLEITNVRFAPALNPNGTVGRRVMTVTVLYRTALEGDVDIAIWAEGFKTDNCTPFGSGDYYGDTHITVKGPGAGAITATIPIALSATTPYFGVNADIQQGSTPTAHLIAHHRCYLISKRLPIDPALAVIPINQVGPYLTVDDVTNWTYDASQVYLLNLRFRIDEPGDYTLVIGWVMFPTDSDCSADGEELSDTFTTIGLTGPVNTRSGVMGVPLPLIGAPKDVAHKFAIHAALVAADGSDTHIASYQSECWEFKPAS